MVFRLLTAQFPLADLRSFVADLDSLLHSARKFALEFGFFLPRLQSNLEANTIHYNVVISACRRDSLWPLSLQLVGGMSSFDLEPSIVSFNSAIGGSSWSMALRLLRQSLDRKLQATTVTYNSAGTQQSYGENAKSQWFFALELLDQLSQKWISSDQLSLTAVMASCQNQWQLVLQLMRPDGSESNDLDVISYTTAINSCGAAKQWERALSFFNEMSNQLVPNRISFGAVISACEKASEWTWAVHLLELAEPLKPNEIICSAVISACEKSSRWEAALFLLRSLNRLTLETTSESYNPVISACSGSQWQLAWELFQQMPTMRLSPDSFSYTAIMKACGQGSQWQTALVFLESPLSSSEGDQS